MNIRVISTASLENRAENSVSNVKTWTTLELSKIKLTCTPLRSAQKWSRQSNNATESALTPSGHLSQTSSWTENPVKEGRKETTLYKKAATTCIVCQCACRQHIEDTETHIYWGKSNKQQAEESTPLPWHPRCRPCHQYTPRLAAGHLLWSTANSDAAWSARTCIKIWNKIWKQAHKKWV